MKHIVVGILAHVDAGKTTLSEALLYAGGRIKKMGRVDKQNSYLDTDVYERERGITIFSKQAVLKLEEVAITLLDTPGHMDFSAEMERSLQVLDYAILVISGADGVQGHTKTLWNLLLEYQIPVFLFVNKMDQQGTDEKKLLKELRQQLSDNCISFEKTKEEEFWEEAAMCSEEALELFLETGQLEHEMICQLIAERKLFPCYFGSALKNTGVKEFFDGVCQYVKQRAYPKEFGAKVFKITRDESGLRLTHLKVTGGSLKVRSLLNDTEKGWEEKVHQIRIYSGEKYEAVDEAAAGELCAVTGLSKTYAGEGLGIETSSENPKLNPVLTYQVLLQKGCDALSLLPKLRQLEEEDPKLHVIWNEKHQEILIRVMGEVQTEILKRQAFDRFGAEIGFNAGHILYKETIAAPVEGVGHFEPLRHYAEVHFLMEPLERGSGLQFESNCSEDVLSKNWQRLILTHLKEKEHLGVLTGSAITDMKITLAAGKAHQKHTEGGDFRQAVYRAVRQGLKQAESILLEPYYEYRLEVPEQFVGRAMTDLKMRHADMEGPKLSEGAAVLIGRAPVSSLQEYVKDVTAYTKGTGKLFLSYGGYDICVNAQEVIERIGYDAEADLENPSSSVFCSHGSGFLVEWDRVPEFMHLESILPERKREDAQSSEVVAQSFQEPVWMETEEVDAILAKTFHANKRRKDVPQKGYYTKKRVVSSETDVPKYRRKKKEETREEYLLVDGYNMIYAWEELRELSKDNMDGARGQLLDLLCNYQGMKQCQVIVVFDAYRIKGRQTEFFDYHNIHVVYTKEAETADAYIEKFAHINGKKYHITVATSDGLEQIIIRGAGCMLLSAKDLFEDMQSLVRTAIDAAASVQKGRSYLLDTISEEVSGQIKESLKERKETT